MKSTREINTVSLQQSATVGLIAAAIILAIIAVPSVLLRVALGLVAIAGMAILAKGNIAFPSHIRWLVLTMIIWGMTLFWVENQIVVSGYWLYFALGVGLYIGSYSLSSRWRIIVIRALTLTSLSYVLVMLFIHALHVNSQSFWYRNELFYLGSAQHLHVADLAALGLVLVWARRTSLLEAIVGSFAGIGGLIWGMSRTALVALGVALLIQTKSSRRRYGLIIAIAIGFIWLSAYKPLLQARPYTSQALQALSYYPLGVGVGNFGLISDQRRFQDERLEYSELAHSLPLEMLIGLGVLSLPFFWWVFLVGRDLQKRGRLLFPVVITTFYLFDSVYFIPIFVWAGFILLAEAQSY